VATECFSSIQGIALRVTRLNSCGGFISGSDCDFVVSEAYISIGLTPEFEEADEFIVKTADGALGVNELGQMSIKRYTLELAVCTVDTDLFNIISGVIPVLDFNGDTVGFEIDQSLNGRNGFALEWWTKLAGDDCVDPVTGEQRYIYWVLPWVKNGRVLDITVENGPMIWALIGDAVPSSSWGVGPYDVVAVDGLNTPGPLLAPMNCNEILHVQVTTVPPPTAECGCGALPDFGYIDEYVDIYE
jgi:hypothetical protein